MLLALLQAADVPPDTTPPSDGASDSAGGQGLFDNMSSEKVTELLETYGLPVLKVLVLLFAAWVVSRWASRTVRKVATKAKVEVTLARFFGDLVRWGILIFALMATLEVFGIKTTSLAAVIAGASLAIGLAFQGSLGNVAAGVMLLIFRPFKVGDVVKVGDVMGKVESISLFTTSIDTPDNRRLIVPNGNIFGAVIENITHHPTRRVDVAVGTTYQSDIDRAREVLVGAARAVQGRLQDQEPVVYLDQMGASSIDWKVRVWAPTADYWAVRERLTRDIKVALDSADIGIPFPQMDVYLKRS
ncbi:MAG: mechanosensitive ion channel [Phycisphaeraceae bacterium]|nr:mechanosensitive ion channel [Phycisphaeraceae bacterium]